MEMVLTDPTMAGFVTVTSLFVVLGVTRSVGSDYVPKRNVLFTIML